MARYRVESESSRRRVPTTRPTIDSVPSPNELVETLADALDGDDYVSAASVLSDQVEYHVGDRLLRGPKEVLASYRQASEMAHRMFERVEYGHRVIPTTDPTTFRVSYTDSLTVGGETLVHHAEQHVTVASGKAIVRLVNVELPGEREKVDAFLERHGLSREDIPPGE
jgi:hypothetical protein